MSYQVPYYRDTFRPVNDVIPGNPTSDNPVEFDLAPAWGPDLARVKSIIYATLGLVNENTWTPDMQDAVIKAFETGAVCFQNTVEAVRGLTVPAMMAKRAGLIGDLPTHVPAGSTTPVPNPAAPIPVVDGLAFSRIAGAVPVMALHVAMRIAAISQKAEALDPRFFVQPSGSGGTGTPRPTATTAGNARRRSRRRGTAARTSTPAAGR